MLQLLQLPCCEFECLAEDGILTLPINIRPAEGCVCVCVSFLSELLSSLGMLQKVFVFYTGVLSASLSCPSPHCSGC